MNPISVGPRGVTAASYPGTVDEMTNSGAAFSTFESCSADARGGGSDRELTQLSAVSGAYRGVVRGFQASVHPVKIVGGLQVVYADMTGKAEGKLLLSTHTTRYDRAVS